MKKHISISRIGSLPERLNGTVLKTVILERVSGVRIPELPQKLYRGENEYLSYIQANTPTRLVGTDIEIEK